MTSSFARCCLSGNKNENVTNLKFSIKSTALTLVYYRNVDHFGASKFLQTAAGNSLKQCEEAASIKQLSSSLSDCYIKASGQVNSGTIDVWSPDSSASQYTSENKSASFTTLIRQCQNKTMVVAMCDCMTIIDSWSRSNNIIS